MNVRIATASEIQRLSNLSRALGNVPFFNEQAIVAFAEQEGKIIGFAATQTAQHAAGSWVKEEYRRKGLTYEMRHALDSELRDRGFQVYFAMPKNDFEKHLFAKYGTVTEDTVQVRHL